MGVVSIHCRNYDCEKWSDCDGDAPWDKDAKYKAKDCKDPKKQIVLGELPK